MSIAFRLSEQKSREGKDRGTGFPEGSSSDAGDPEESHGGRKLIALVMGLREHTKSQAGRPQVCSLACQYAASSNLPWTHLCLPHTPQRTGFSAASS